MPISLEAVQRKLVNRLGVLNSAFERHTVAPTTQRRIDRHALQEGLVSSLWQSWSRFCREIIIASAKGATTEAGVAVTSAYAAHSEMEIAYIAGQFARGDAVGRIRPLAGNHLEPTWGDARKLNLMIVGLASTNQTSLLSAVAGCQRVLDLQLCRNASAHISGDTLSQIKAAAVRYTGTSHRHPSDLMFWVDPLNRDFVWRSWIDEIEIVSELAVK